MSVSTTIGWIRRAALLRRARPNDPTLASHANAHFPGLYRLACEGGGGSSLRTRMYLAPPGALHPWLTDPDSPFLWHGHAYDFRSTTFLGRVENNLLTWASTGDRWTSTRTRIMYAHAVRHDDTGLTVSPNEDRGRRMIAHAPTLHTADDTYALTGEQIHRVTFVPDPVTGWFAAMIEETRRRHPAHAAVGWSTQRLTEVPGQAELYQPIDADKIDALAERLARSGT